MGINEYAMWNYKNGKPWYIQQTEVTMVRGVTEAVPCLLLVDHPDWFKTCAPGCHRAGGELHLHL